MIFCCRHEWHRRDPHPHRQHQRLKCALGPAGPPGSTTKGASRFHGSLLTMRPVREPREEKLGKIGSGVERRQQHPGKTCKPPSCCGTAPWWSMRSCMADGTRQAIHHLRPRDAAYSPRRALCDLRRQTCRGAKCSMAITWLHRNLRLCGYPTTPPQRYHYSERDVRPREGNEIEKQWGRDALSTGTGSRLGVVVVAPQHLARNLNEAPHLQRSSAASV